MAEKKKYETYVSPRGVAQYPHLAKPDEYKGKKNFKTNLIFSDGVFDDVMADLEARAEALADEVHAELIAKAKKAGKKAPPRPDISMCFWQEVDDEENETGRVVVRFSTSAEDKDGNPKTLRVFDSQGNRLKKVPRVGGGSVLKVEYTPSVSYVEGQKTVFGKFYLNAVQIIDLHEYDGSGASKFGKEAGGWTANGNEDDDDEDASSFSNEDKSEDGDDEDNGDF